MLQLLLEGAEGIGKSSCLSREKNIVTKQVLRRYKPNNKFPASFCLVLVSQSRNRMAVCFWGTNSITDKFRVGSMILMSHLGLLLGFGVIL